MPLAPSNGIEICYDTLGDPSHPAVLLVMGLGAQLIAWPEDLCRTLASAGRFVIRFDNRDAGLSTKFDGVFVDLPAIMAAWAGNGVMPEVPYTLSDMSNDAFGLLDHLGIQRAHIVGASLGGMIVQTMAVEHPERVISLTSIMSTTGEPEFYRSVPEVRAALLAPRPLDRDGNVAAAVAMSQMLGSPRYFDPANSALSAEQAYDRSFYPIGALRQTAAIRASESRAEKLRGLTVPTLVVHGREDRLILPIGGERTAEIVPGAHLLLLADMGHDMPAPLQPFLIDAVLSHTKHAGV